MSPSQILKKAHRACKTGESLRAFARRVDDHHCPSYDPDAGTALPPRTALTKACGDWLEGKDKQRPRSPERLAAKGSAVVHGAAVLRSCAPTNHAVSMRGNANARKAAQ